MKIDCTVNKIIYTICIVISIAGYAHADHIPSEINKTTDSKPSKFPFKKGVSTIADNRTSISPPSFSYPYNNTYGIYKAIASLVPTSTGGTVSTYTISPSLPTGLSLSASTGYITGTPYVTSAQTLYTVTGTNSAGNSTASFYITVVGYPAFSYTTPDAYVINGLITPIGPTSTGGAIGAYNNATNYESVGNSDGLTVCPSGTYANYLYVASKATGDVYIYNPSGTLVSTQTGYNTPEGIAVDGSGTTYVADGGAADVVITTAGGVKTTVTASGTAFSRPVAIALDASGNAYVTDYNNGIIYKIASGSSTATVYISGLSRPWGITVDSFGNIYFTSLNNNYIYKVPAGSTTPAALVTSGLNSPRDLLVDASGTIYEADANPSGLGSINAINSSTGAVSLLFNVYNSPIGIGRDASGNLYTNTYNFSTIFKATLATSYTVSPTLPAGLSINPYNGYIAGTPTVLSAATNYTVTGTNAAGNTTTTVNISVVSGYYYYWTGNAGTTNWTTANNWYNTSTNSVYGYPGDYDNNDIAYVYTSNITINLTASETIATLSTPNYGTSNLIVSFSGSPTLTINTSLAIAQPTGSSIGISFKGAGTAIVNNSATFNYQAGLYIGTSATVTFNTNVTSFNGNPAFVNDGTLNVANVTFQPGNTTTNDATGIINITGSSGLYSTSSTISNAGTINCTSGTISTSASLFTNTGTVNCTSSATISTSGGPSSIETSNIFNLSSSTIKLGNNSDNFVNTSPGVVTAISSTFNMAGASAFLYNSATFKATSSTFSFGNQNSVLNLGTFTTQSGCTFGLTSSSNCTISNSGTYKDHGSTYTMSGQTANILNSGASATFAARGTTFTQSGNSANITNSSGAAFTADSASTMTLSGYGSYINNSSYFNAGTSGSVCSINISNQAVNITNTGSSSQKAYFNLGSTSVINVNSGYQPYVSNSTNGYSFFTLMSDAKGSATIGQIQATGISSTSSTQVFQGKFNIQRYMTGGSPSSTYRTYRVLTSPTNTVSATPGTASASNYTDFSNFSNNSSYNRYTVYSNSSTSATYYGAFSGGTTGFSVSNPNPTIYLYNETLNPSSATKNATFISGKDVGLTSISSTSTSVTGAGTTNGVPYTLGSTSIPVGNGFLLFYIGSINGRTSGATSLVPDNATITNVGYINQQSILTYLWYTPGGGSSGQLSYSTAVTNYKGINMLGNPYASTIDLKKVYSDNSSSTGFTTFYELVDVNPGQAYVSYNGYTGATSSSTYSSEYVASGQGFLVLATATGQSLTFNEDQKVYNTSLLNSTSTPPVLLNAQNPDGFKSLTAGTNNALLQNNNTLTGLHLKLMGDTATFDECGIYFNPAGADAYNTNDALDLDGINPKVYMSSYTSDGIRTGINTLANYTNGKRIKLYVRATTDGIYHLNLEDMANIDTTNFSVYLIDTKLNDSLDMVHYKTYDFNLTAADTAAFRTRFVLAIERKAMPPYSLVTFTGQKANTAIQLNWKTSGEGNYTGFGLEKLQPNGQYLRIDSVQSDGTGLYTFNDINPVNGSNIYRLEQNDINGKVSFAGPININYNTISVSGMFTIYPNPSKAIINVSVNSSTTGNAVTQTYVANIYDLSGSMMNTRQVNTNNWTQDVTGYKAGVYILELKTTDGNIVGKAKFVKVN